VEDKEYRIVRFNGTYTSSKTSSLFGLRSNTPLYFHFDSWRVNVAPGKWVPAFVYVEESGNSEKGDKQASSSRFKAQTRLWGYNSTNTKRLDELATDTKTADVKVDTAGKESSLRASVPGSIRPRRISSTVEKGGCCAEGRCRQDAEHGGEQPDCDQHLAVNAGTGSAFDAARDVRSGIRS
jgi:hypothetical protein